jgi:hypothetical protein
MIEKPLEDPGNVVICEDVSNAYGSVSRKDIAAELARLRSPLLAFLAGGTEEVPV